MSHPGDIAAADAREQLARLEYEMAAPPFHAVLQPEAVTVEPDGSVVIRLPFNPVLRGARDANFYHGGVIASLVDLAAHAAVAIRVGHRVPTVDLRVDYLRAFGGVDLVATARVVGAGRSIGRADVEIKAGETVIALGRAVFSTVKQS